MSILGLLGNRLDHTLYNVELIKKFTNVGLTISAYTESEEIFVADQSIELKAKPGTRISMSPIYGEVKDIQTDGFEFDLKDTSLKFGEVSSISNVFKQPVAQISFSTGQLLILLQHQMTFM